MHFVLSDANSRQSREKSPGRDMLYAVHSCAFSLEDSTSNTSFIGYNGHVLHFQAGVYLCLQGPLTL
jgi:hypothetical protein